MQVSRQDLIHAFGLFDVMNDGKISVSTFKYYMTTMGEKLMEDEIDEMLKEVTLVDGRIDLNSFVSLILSK